MTPESSDSTSAAKTFVSSMGSSTKDHINVQGYDLADDLMGKVDFGAMFFLLLVGRLPSDAEAALFNAVLVALADHGMTPSVLAARLTYTGAPEAVQGAVAAGVLGAGSVFLGVFEDSGRFLVGLNPPPDANDSQLDAVARTTAEQHRQHGWRLPGFGHPVHKTGDPRTKALHRIAREHDLLGVHFRLALQIEKYAQSSSGVPLPLNAGGACGAILTDLGIPTTSLRGVAAASRVAGIVGHLAEEARDPIGTALWHLAEERVLYVSHK
ncbi:citryl-CoA lyase [Mycobacterium sp. 21AC1]|uniref:citryl-CoA lyase n=1 Tax=[Mycobacterium] appelbergii TaxID=2939269 RepID=UPI0029392F24|nr:citryl-CoA lyase [Mycobacterium sp. 21AC1]MDV3128638.1 citryl-CoA lyase [Mycobacterium sp. 21AC1]